MAERLRYFNDVVSNIKKFVALRDNAGHATTRGAPILLHGYDYFQPRPAKAEIFSGGSLGRGPWLHPVLLSAGFDSMQMRSAADAVVDQLNVMLVNAIATLPNVHVIDSRGLLTPAAPDTTGETDHWLDEIHPSSAGFEKLARCCWNGPLAELLKYVVQDGDLDAACQPVAATTALADTPLPTTMVA